MNNNIVLESNDIKGNTKFVFYAVFLIIFIFSIVFAPFHSMGDQVHYRKAYQIVYGLSLGDALKAYRTVIYSFEIVHPLVCWIGSNVGIDKDVLMAFINAILGVCCIIYLYKKTGRIGFSVLFVIGNYYLLAMYFTLEKLKFAFMFFVIFLNSSKNNKLIYGLLILSVLSHFQMTIIIGAMFSGHILQSRNFKFKLIDSFILILVITVGVLIGIRFNTYILSKASYYLAYAAKISIIDLLFIILLSFLTVYFSKRRIFALTFMSIIFIAVLFLGGDRLNMFFFFAFIGFANFKNQVARMVLYLLLIFLLYKSGVYLNMVIRFGG